jgi:hypothetical protein
MFHVKHFCPIDSLRKALSQGGAKYGSEILPVQNDRLVLGFGPIFLFQPIQDHDPSACAEIKNYAPRGRPIRISHLQSAEIRGKCRLTLLKF